MQCGRIYASGEGLARGRHGEVVGARKARYAVEKYHYIPAVFNQPLSSFEHHFRNLYVVLRQLIEGGIDHFAVYGAFHVCHFLRAFVYEQDNEVYVRVVAAHAVCDIF